MTNAHLSHLGGQRGFDTPNQQRVLLVDGHDLVVALLRFDAIGPIFTFSSGNHTTTTDRLYPS